MNCCRLLTLFCLFSLNLKSKPRVGVKWNRGKTCRWWEEKRKTRENGLILSHTRLREVEKWERKIPPPRQQRERTPVLLMLAQLSEICYLHTRRHAIFQQTEKGKALRFDAFKKFDSTFQRDRSPMTSAEGYGLRRLRSQWLLWLRGEVGDFSPLDAKNFTF